MRLAFCAGFLTLLLIPIAQADLLPPGHRSVQHILRIDNIHDYPEYVFYVYPRDLPRGRPGNSSARVDDKGEANFAGNPLARRKGAFLYAIPRTLFKDPTLPPEEEWFEKPAKGIFKSDPLVGQIRSVPVADPRKQILTRYRVAIKDGLKLTQVPEEKTGQEEEEASVSTNRRWLIAAGAGMCALISCLGLLVTRLRRREERKSDAGPKQG
jgi:hypothetical protein